MVIKRWRRMALVLFLSCVGASVLNCSGTVGTQHEDGMIYVVNNIIPYEPGVAALARFATAVWVEYEGVRYDVSFNMDGDRNSTGAGNFELTEEPLPGGTTVTIKCVVVHGVSEEKNITVTIDGNMTIEIYWEEWTNMNTGYLLRIVPGKWDGIHHYL